MKKRYIFLFDDGLFLGWVSFPALHGSKAGGLGL
jgi:hypothetical protein